MDLITQKASRFEVKILGTNEDKIAELKEKFAGYVINGIEDKAGYDKVYKSRQEVKNLRINVEKNRLAFSKFKTSVDTRAKKLTTLLTEIEKPLEVKELQIDLAKQAIKGQAQDRVNELAGYGVHVEYDQAKKMSESEYAVERDNAKTAWEIQQQKIMVGNQRVALYNAIETLCRFEDVVEQSEEEFEKEYAEAAEIFAEKKRIEARRKEVLRWQEELAKADYSADTAYLANLTQEEYEAVLKDAKDRKQLNPHTHIVKPLQIFHGETRVVGNVVSSDSELFKEFADRIEGLVLPLMSKQENQLYIDNVGKHLRQLAWKVRVKE